MPFVLIAVAIILVASGVKGTQKDLGAMLKQDFTGSHSYFAWLLSIMAVGAVGYITPLKPISNAFLVLIIVVLFLSNGGFFNKLVSGLGIGTGGLSSTSTPTLSGTSTGLSLQSNPLLSNFNINSFSSAFLSQ